MSKVLVLGAGFVAGPLINYLNAKGYRLTLANQDLKEAEARVGNLSNIEICELDVTDEASLGSLIAAHDLTVSLVPYIFHPSIARLCLKAGKHLVTASYQSEEMKALHDEAKEKGLTFINEVGLDPGIDHLTAMQIIDEIHDNGGKLNAFVSWCGGLPAPSANDNPLGYKFAWAPKGVLLALLNEASYLKNGQIEKITGDQLLSSARPVRVSENLDLEGYPNRDSVSYQSIYGIEEAGTLLRGTLRYSGFSAILQACRELGLLSQSSLPEGIGLWSELVQVSVDNLQSFLAEQTDEVRAALDWLGILEAKALPSGVTTPIDAFCQHLMKQLAYAKGEHDMIVLQHKFVSETAEGVTEHRRSTLILEGDEEYSAMARTVGTPAAIAADLILSGELKERGVVLPMSKAIYNPMLKALEEANIRVEEELLEHPLEDFLAEI